MVHFSSDFVFDGAADRPYQESDPPNPLGVYAMSKLLGEWFALEAPRGYVLRVESLFGRAPDAAPAKGSVAAIVNALLAGQAPRVFEDRTVSPGYVLDIAAAVRTMLENDVAPGLYHCVNSGACTWLEFAQEAARQLGIEARFDVVRFADVTFAAPRPRYCALSNAKLAAAGIVMPSWQDALARHLSVRDDIGDQIANRQTRRQSRRFDAGRLHQRRVLAIATNQEVGPRNVRRMQLGADAAAGEAQRVRRYRRQQPARRFDEGLELAGDRSRSRPFDPGI